MKLAQAAGGRMEVLGENGSKGTCVEYALQSGVEEAGVA